MSECQCIINFPQETIKMLGVTFLFENLKKIKSTGI